MSCPETETTSHDGGAEEGHAGERWRSGRWDWGGRRMSEIDVTGDRGTSRLWGPEFIAELVAPFEFIRKI